MAIALRLRLSTTWRGRLAPTTIAVSCVTAGLIGGATQAGAAEVRVTGPETCADAQAIAEEAEQLLGQPLASVTGVDYEVILAPAAKSWRLRLDTVEPAPEGTGPPGT